VFRPSAGNDDCPDPNGFYSHYAGNRGEEVENVLNARSKKSRVSRQFDLDIGSALCRG
jgi:hypothetical protein